MLHVENKWVNTIDLSQYKQTEETGYKLNWTGANNALWFTLCNYSALA